MSTITISFHSSAVSYFNINNNQLFLSDLKIKSAVFAVNYFTGMFMEGNVEIAAHPVSSEWSESTITYNTKPTLDEAVDKKTFSSTSSSGYQYFDVTKAFTSGKDNYGIALQQTDDVLGEAMLVFYSSEYESDTNKQPYFKIEFYESQGVEEQYDYHAFDAGRAGIVYLNDFTNQIYIERDELGLSGLNMPVQIKRYYNSGWGGTYSNKYFLNNSVFATNGFGWQTNYNQFLEYHDNIDGTQSIIYYNGQGKATYFEKTDTEADGKCKWTEKTDKFSNSQGYTLWVNVGVSNTVKDNLNQVTIEDSNGQIYEFNQKGLLTKINSAEEGSTACITVSYTSVTISGVNYTDVINTITDGAGRQYKFSYTTYADYPFPLLTSIQAYTADGTAIKMTDEENYRITYTYSFQDMYDTTVPILASATYPDGEVVNYTVGNIESTVQNIDGYTIKFYKYDNGVGISELVYTDDVTTPVNGGELKILTVNNNAYERVFWDPNDVIQTKQFDLYGRVVNIKNNDGTSVPRTYSENFTACGEISYGVYVDYEYDVETEGQNIITNGSFSNGTTGWELSDNNKVVRVTEQDCEENTETPASLRIIGQQNNIYYATQTISIPDGLSGDEYQLEYFIKNNKNSHNVTDTLSISTVLVEAKKSETADGEWETVATADINPFNTNWQKYRHIIDIGFDYNEIRLTLAYYFQYGRVWFDDVSLINTFKETADTSSTPDDSTSSEDDSSETDECTCEGCSRIGCECRDCSENCSKVSCKASYSFESDSNGTYFTITDGTNVMGANQTIDGNYYGTQKDLNGIQTNYNYNQSNGQMMSISNGNGEIEYYTYDAMSRLNGVTKSVSGLSNSQDMVTSYNYEDDRIDSITHNGFSYNYQYDVWGNLTSVKVGEQPLVSYGYGENQNRNRPNRITYGNGDYTDYIYSNAGNITALKSYSADNTLSADYEYTYNEYNEIEVIKNNIENTEIRYIDEKIQAVLLNEEGSEDDIVIFSSEFNENDETVETLFGRSYTQSTGNSLTDSETGESTLLSRVVSQYNTYDFGQVSDFFGRQTEKTLETSVKNTSDISRKLNFETQYKYKHIGLTETTSLVSSYRAILNLVTENPDDEATSSTTIRDWEYLYSYDSNGNIVDISVTFCEGDADVENESICSYIYDEAGQLVRENNLAFLKSYTYVYDKGGNLAQKSEYDYTTEELGEAISTVNYTYDTQWKDKLTAYGDISITADSMGNPLNMVSGNFLDDSFISTLEWNGRQLESVTIDGIKYAYGYNADGLRTKMIIYDSDGVTVNGMYYYFWESGKLTGYCVTDSEGNIEHTVKMLFDNTGDSVGYELYSTEDNSCKAYYFHKNLQGDITNVFNDEGRKIVSYYYDAWGNISAEFDYGNADELTESTTALTYTPITYRGYNYDFYSGLYYLQSRYYNPTYGRFLNADTTEILETTQGTTHGANLFAYCSNNPIRLIDPTGENGGDILAEENTGGMGIGLGVFIAIALLIFCLQWIIEKLTNLWLNNVLPWLEELVTDVTSEIRDILEIDVPETLEGQMQRAKTKADKRGRTKKTNKHHIVAKIDRRAKKSREILEASRIDINDQKNIAVMNQTAHWYLHTSLYHSSVEIYLSNAHDSGGTLGVVFALYTLKIELEYL